MRGRLHLMIVFLVCFLMAYSLGAVAEQAFPTLPLDTFQGGPAPRDEHYLSDTLYQDDTIRVEIFSGHAADTDYTYAHVKISNISQLRTAPAGLVNSNRATFKSSSPPGDALWPGQWTLWSRSTEITTPSLTNARWSCA